MTLFNNEVKMFLTEIFHDEVQFCNSERKNQSAFVFSSSVKLNDVVNMLRSMDATKAAASELRRSILSLDYGLKDKFCDAEEVKESWRSTKMPDQWITFLCELFNVKKSSFLHSYYSDHIIDDEEEDHPQDDHTLAGLA